MNEPTHIADMAQLRVMLMLEQSCHDATRRELVSTKARLERKPHSVRIAMDRFRPIAEADMTPGTEIIGYDQESGNIFRSVAQEGTVITREPHYSTEEVYGWWIYGTGGHMWKPTHFLPFPGDVTDMPE